MTSWLRRWRERRRQRAPARGRGWRRVLRVVFRIVALLVGLPTLLLLLAMYTAVGRDQLRAVALRIVNERIAGTLEIDELARIDLGGVDLRGVHLLDPQGHEVLALDVVQIDLSAAELLDSLVWIERLRLDGLRLDLRQLDSVDRGLLAAVTTAPSEAEAEPSSSAWVIDLRSIELSRAELTADVPQLGEVSVRGLSAAAGLRIDEHVSVDLHSLSFGVHDARGVVATLARATGRYRTDGEPSTLDLDLSAGAAALKMKASALAPPSQAWQQGPLQLDLSIAKLDPALLRLAHIEPPEQLGGPLDVELKLRGTLDDIDGRLTLSSPAGAVLLSLQLKDRDELKLRLTTNDLNASKLWRGAPAEPLTVELTGRARLGGAPAKLPFELELSHSRLGDAALPDAQLSGRLEGERIRALKLSADGYGGSLKLRGEAGLDASLDATLALHVPHIGEPLRLLGKKGARGAVRLNGKLKLAGKQIDASASADVRGLHIDDIQFDEATMLLTVKGALPTPAVSAVIQTGNGSVAGRAIEPSTLRVTGGPDVYRLKVDAGAAGGRVELDATVVRRQHGLLVDASGSGNVAGHPLSLSLEGAQVGFDGKVEVGALEVEALGQKASLRGALRGKVSEQLVLETGELDLAALSKTLGIEPPLRGKSTLRVSLAGHAERPIINLSGRAKGVQLPASETRQRLGSLSGDWSGTIDTVNGKLEMRAAAAVRHGGASEPKADLTLRGEFPARGPWPQQLPKGEYKLRLELRDVSVAYVEALLGRPLPVTGMLGAVIIAEGAPLNPMIDVKAYAHLAHPESGDPLEVTASAHYDDGAVDLMTDVVDQHGHWIWFEAGAEHPTESLPELLAGARRLGTDARWRVRLRVQERRVDGIPVALEIPPALQPARVYALVTATHEPRAEPAIDAMVDVRYPPIRKLDGRGQPIASERCQPRPLLARAHATVGDGKVELRVLAGSRTRRWLSLKSEGKVSLTPLLRGLEPALPSELGYELDLARVNAEELPIVCDVARGSIRGSGRGRDVLGAKPTATLRIELDDLGLGGRESLEGHVDVALGHEDTRLDARLSHGSHHSRGRARLPLALASGKLALRRDGPMQAELVLDRLPLGALIPVDGPVSRVRGHLNGNVKASGSLAAPRVAGKIHLVDARMTATAVAQPLRRINGTITFDNDKVRVEKLVARDGEGKLEVKGVVHIGKLPKAAKMAFDVALDDFPVRQDGQVAATVNLNAHLTADIDEKHTEAKLKLRKVDMWLEEIGERGIPLAVHPDIVDPRAPAKPKVVAVKSTRTLRLKLDLSEPFWVKRDDMAVKLSSQIDIRVGPKGTLVTGEAIMERGYLQLLGKTFDIDRGSKLTFVGTSPPDPAVEISAQLKNRRSGDTIGVRITGRASQPKVTFLVEGSEVTAGEAVAAMFGDRSSADENAAEGQAKSFLAGVAGGMLALAARKELGAATPIILVDPGQNTSQSRLRAGFELDELVPGFMESVIRGVYVEGIVAGDDGTGTGGVHGGVLLDLFLPESLVLTGQYGPGETWAVDFGWEP